MTDEQTFFFKNFYFNVQILNSFGVYSVQMLNADMVDRFFYMRRNTKSRVVRSDLESLSLFFIYLIIFLVTIPDLKQSMAT